MAKKILVTFNWLLVTLIMVMVVAGASWGIPQKIAFSGRLTDSRGNAITSVDSVTFKLYDSQNGGNRLGSPPYEETMSNLTLPNGIINATLSIPPEIFQNNDNVWLEVSFVPSGGNSVTLSRQQLVSVPFAYRAAVADSAAAGGGWTTDGSTKTTTNYNVGIGTTAPSATLEVVGEVGISRKDTRGFPIQRLALNPAGSIQFNRRDLETGFLLPADLLLNPDGGNVGIGTTEPRVKLDVRDATSGAVVYGRNTYPSGGIGLVGSYAGVMGESERGIGVYGVGPTAGKFDGNLLVSGNVGIGTTSPRAKLEVSVALTDNVTKPLAIGKGISNYLTVSNTGNVGIGTTTPTKRLDIAGELQATGTGNNYFAGNVGIGTTAPIAKLEVAGGIRATDWVTIGGPITNGKLNVFGEVFFTSLPDVTGSNWSLLGVDNSTGRLYKNISPSPSSRRYKEDIKKLEDNFTKVLDLEPKSFVFKSSGVRDIGYIAEDLDEFGLKNLVIYDRNGQPDGIKYEKISVYLVEIIKGLKDELRNIKAENETLKQRLEALESGRRE